MSVFEPKPALTICSRTYPTREQNPFKQKWKTTVESRTVGWKKARKTQSVFEPQLRFTGECTTYIDFTAEKIRPAKGTTEWRALPPDWPLYGPDFIPPTFAHYLRRNAVSECDPEWSYIKKVKTLHPIFFPFISRCPHCRSTNVHPNGWTSTGYREVHGLQAEEVVIGVQLRCGDCAAKHSKGGQAENEENVKYCFSTTNAEFWQQMAVWEIPRGVPLFFHRSAVSSELFDFIVECRLTENSAAIAEHVKQFHLLEYHRNRLEYLQFFEARTKQTSFVKKPDLRNYSEPQHAGKALNGYDGTSITDDLVSDVYARFCEQRRNECDEHLRTLTATTLSLDATFRTASKALFVNKDNTRSSVFGGGLHTALNQKALILAYRWCYTLLHSEIGEMLFGLKRRFELLNVDNPWAVTVDNCCHFRNAIMNVFPETAVVQDVWHVIMRYMVCVLGGTKNPHRAEVGEDISNAIIKARAHDGIPARYWSQEEQEERLTKAYEKWVAVSGVWSAAAEKTHHEQLEHVRKGCLARPREDITTDGSRIEGSHKGWNSLQRTHASGVEVLTNLAADHVLRHNIRVDHNHSDPYPFTKSTFGSHHVHLVNACARLWNTLLQPANRDQKRPPADLLPAPVLEPADSGESFGLIKANRDVTAYHTFVKVKDEPQDPLVDLSSQDPDEADRVVASLGIDPALLHQPLAPCSTSSSGTRTTTASLPSNSTMPSLSHPTIAFTAASAPDVIDVDALLDTSAPAPEASRKRPASSTSSRAQEECMDGADPTATFSDKRARSSSSDASSPSMLTGLPSSSSPMPSSITTHLPSFFPRCQLDPGPDQTAATPPATCLPVPVIAGQTRSQRIISAVTGFDPQSLKFSNDDTEYFLFMDLRALHQWATYKMTAAMWVEAASVYNLALEAKKDQDDASIIRKTPRALMEKLQAIEATIHYRKKNNDYKSKSGSTMFWECHCNAVPLAPSKPSKGKGKNTTQALSARKPHTCHRCLSIMWAGGEGGGENHKKGYCSDGVKQKPTPIDGFTEELPPWPQPNEVFTKGTMFWPKRFIRTVRELYDTVIVNHDLGGIKAMEYMAFADMLRARLIVIPPTETQPSIVRFKLYRGLVLGEQPDPASDLVTVDGVDYLHVSYLSEDGFHEVAGLAAGSI